VRLQEPGCRTFPVAHDGCQDDGTVDLAAARLLGGLHRRVQDTQQFGVGRGLCAILCAHVLEQPPEVSRNVRSKSNEVDAAGLENG
jgi:hypothetical protein